MLKVIVIEVMVKTGLITAIIPKKNSILLRLNSRVWIVAKNDNNKLNCGDFVSIQVKQTERKYIAENIQIETEKSITNEEFINQIAKKYGLHKKPYLERKFFAILHVLGKKRLLQKLLRNEQYPKYIANPYELYLNRLADFTTAEAISNILHTPQNDEEKLPAIAYHIIEDAYYKENKNSLTLVEFQKRLTAIGYTKLPEHQKLIYSDGSVYADWIFFLKKRIINTIAEQQTCFSFQSDDPRIQKLLSFRYSVLTGPAGSGKSTLLKKIAKEFNGKTLMTATTGRAAKILTGDAKTIHWHLGYKNGKYTTSKLDCDLLVVDEASLIDLQLLYAILKAADRVIFSGDFKQLSPVKGESVFSMLLNHLPVVLLNGNYREEKGAKIYTLIKNRSEVLNTVLNLYKTLHKKGSVVILSPVLEGALGVIAINRYMSQRFTNGVKKVLITKNVYQDNRLVIANGEYAELINKQNGKVTIRVENLDISISETHTMPAYAMTVHKAIGTEYDYVIFILPDGVRDDFINDQLMEVATSRARKMTYMILQKPHSI
jgi:energy-coupling factor transporter ATP-binding protein EcfA2